MKAKTIDEYIAAAPKGAQGKLREMRAIIRSAAPDAIEGIKWSMPAFSCKRILVMFAAFKHHIGFYPTASVMKAHKKELAKYKTGRGSIQFPLDKPIPKSLVKKMTVLRVREEREKDVTWM